MTRYRFLGLTAAIYPKLGLPWVELSIFAFRGKDDTLAKRYLLIVLDRDPQDLGVH
jgi:hypothetical protein